MPISIRICPPMETRPCRFCLGLQDDSVFADFDLNAHGQIFLRRISFDGFGCCRTEGLVKMMTSADSRILQEAVNHDAVDNPNVDSILRTYFQQNTPAIWPDALASHGLL